MVAQGLGRRVAVKANALLMLHFKLQCVVFIRNVARIWHHRHMGATTPTNQIINWSLL